MDKTLLNLIEEIIKKPLLSLDYNRPLEEVIMEVDVWVDDYILLAQKLVAIQLKQAYWNGVEEAIVKLDAVGADFESLMPDKPLKLDFLIGMLQRNVEDYALVLRGRLRSSIEAKFWLDED